MSKQTHRFVRSLRLSATVALVALSAGVANLSVDVAHAASTPPTLPISQVPLTVVQPTHPQVLIAIGNSESMDGNLSGAIMAGSGSLGSSLSSLSSASSPTNFTIPSGFTPPVNAGSGGTAPYTVSQNGTLYDNSPSRLNVAKAGISAIINQYMPSTDFGLMDYGTTGTSLYTTWVYYMSASGGNFTFTNTAPTNGTEYVTNPCYNYSSASSTIKSNCSSIDSTLYSGKMGTYQYMIVGASSDDPSINDVLYAGSQPGVYVTYGGVTPSNPYTYYTLAKYNSGGINTTYSKSVPSANQTTSPTNAGYIPYSAQVMYAERGFGYGANDAKTGGVGNVVAKDSSGNAIISAGQSPTSSSVATAVAYFSAALQPETNSTSSSEIKALAGQSALAGMLTTAKSTLASSLPTTSSGCTPPKQYVVLITDGLPTEDLQGKFWPPVGSVSATGYGMTAAFNSDGSLNTSGTNDQALIDTITAISNLNAAGVETYVIGLGAGVDPTKNPQAAATLAAMSVAGGSAATASKITGSTQYFPATSPAALVTDLQSILSDVASQSSSSSSATANSTSLNANSQVYQATFTPGSTAVNAWIGDLQEYGINASATINTTATWSAQAQLDTLTSSTRNIATWDPYHISSGTTVTPAAVGFSWSNLSSTLQTQLAQNSNNGQYVLNFIRGDHSQEQTNGGTLRTRAHLLGDVVDSSPAFVSVPAGAFQDDSYATFAASSTVQNRNAMLYFGANDGMLHGVNASTGKEVMAFIPNGGTSGVFSNLYMLASPYYFYHHQFFVDGSPQVSDALLSTDGKWHTMLVGGENGGGSTIYALDVTNPNNFTSDANVASAVLWEFSDSDMGLSYSTPVIARSAAVTVTDKTSSPSTTAAGFAVIFGNGYNSASGHPIFYAVDASTGAQLAKIDLCNAVATTSPNACSTTLPNGLSSISVANSSGVAGVVQDMAYAGDLQGNLWAINMSNSTPSKWTVTLLFQARDSSGNAQPITTAPALTLNPNFPTEFGLMAFFGTGELLTQADLTSTNVQTVYGVWDNTANLTSYAKPYPAPPYTRSNLAQQTLSVVTATVSGTSVKGVTSSANPVNLTFASVSATNPSPPPATITVAPQEGWYFDLSTLGSGTRSFTTLAVDAGGVKFTTNQPPANSCAQPNSYFLNVDYRSGGALPSASIGLPNSGVTISSATVNGKTVVLSGVYVTNAYAAAPTSVQSGSGTSVNIISTANGLQTVATQGFQPGRVGWWQVQ